MTLESDLTDVKNGKHLRLVGNLDHPEVCMWGVYTHLTGYNGPCSCCLNSVPETVRPAMMLLLTKKLSNPLQFLKTWQTFPEYYKSDVNIVKTLADVHPQFAPLFQIYVDETLHVSIPKKEPPVPIEKVEFEPEEMIVPVIALDLQKALADEVEKRKRKTQLQEEYIRDFIEKDFLHIDRMKEENGKWEYENAILWCHFKATFNNLPIHYDELLKQYGKSRNCLASYTCAEIDGNSITISFKISPNVLSKEQRKQIDISIRQARLAKKRQETSVQIYQQLLADFKKEEAEKIERLEKKRRYEERANINQLVNEYFKTNVDRHIRLIHPSAFYLVNPIEIV